MNRSRSLNTALFLAVSFPLFAFACSDAPKGSPNPEPTTAPTTKPTTPEPTPTTIPTDPQVTKACASAGLTRCDETGRIETCTADAGGNLAWGPKARCGDASKVCKGSACVAANADAVSQVADLKRVTDFLLDYHPWRGPVDEAKVREDSELRLLLGDGSGETFFQVAQGAFRMVPGGHSGLYSYYQPTGASACAGTKDDKIAVPGVSWHGVCTAVSGQDIIVTMVKDTANLAVDRGERIVGVSNGTASYAGPTMLDKLGELPICRITQPFADAQRDVTGSSILSLAKPGWVLRVRNTSGVERDVTVPARLDSPVSCVDGGFNRAAGADRFTVTKRADGYLVVWIKTFAGTAAYPFPAQLTVAAYKQWITGWIANLNAEIAKYPDAKGIVWDVRGNQGGSQDLAIALAMGPKAPALRGGLVKCLARKPKTHPADFEPASTPTTATADKILPVPELDGASSLFSYPGKQIVVSSGDIYSAADLFVFAAKAAGLKIVGRPGPGAFGALVGPPLKVLGGFLVKDIPVYPVVSGWSCVDSSGNAIEGKPPTIDFPTEQASADLAMGRDTVIEEAVKQLAK